MMQPAPIVPDRALTGRQHQILAVIERTLAERGYPPSMREIARQVHLTSASSVKYHLEILESKGYLRRDERTSRGIEVIKDESTAPDVDPARNVPLLGRIAAGNPVLAEEDVEGFFPLPRSLVGEGDVFMLKVKGDSMTGSAIEDGDLVIVRRQHIAENGQIVAAQIDGEATVKTFAIRDGKVWLEPSNPAYSPIDGGGARILGRVVCLVRTM
ncbi:MAG: transcriptional repressor LexA [Bifidobacteriaceae bacterium]|jgi:repressor LexA|nr:transcriptional repressor LexA [Bifidobacteriaceae bacterium]